MSRRNFLKLCGLAGLGFSSAISCDSLHAAPADEMPPYTGPFYIVLNASGGWDTTYLMDPKGINGINRLYEAGDIQTEGAHRFAPTAKQIAEGMSNEDFYRRYGHELLTFNGIDMSVNNHTPCARYMATGKLDSNAYPTFPALVAACRGPSVPLAFLTFGNYSATGNIVPMSRVPYLQTLKLLSQADFVEGNERAPYHDAFVADRIEATLQAQFEARVETTRLPRVERSQSMLYAAQANSQALKRIVPFIPKQTAKERLAQQAEIAIASFKAGVCVAANLSIGQFDSHNNNDKDQMKLIPEFLAGVDFVMRKAEELQIREQLVVILQSEMGRTPNYNNGQGKDHWSIGSMMFMGQSIRGNRVLGATDDGQFAKPIDAKTFDVQTTEGQGTRVRPEHMHVALRQLAGIADHPLSQRFPLVIPESERLGNLFNPS